MKKLILILLPLACMAQVQTYTITPTSNSIRIKSSFGVSSVRPINSVFLQYTRDSQSVAFANIFCKSLGIMQMPDSIIHFYSGDFHFTSKSSLDSFYRAVLTK